MSKTNIITWGKFKVGKIYKDNKWLGSGLFKIINSSSYHEKDVTEAKYSNGINYVVRTKYNNGIKYRVEKNTNFKINPAKTISFGAENRNFFYQSEEYITGNKMYYIDTSDIDEYACLFFVAVLQKTFNERYSFSNGMIPSQIYDKEIQLPIDSNGNPDWDYMKEFMENIHTSANKKLNICKALVNNSYNKINITSWEKFHLYDENLFYIDMGTKLDRVKMTEKKPTINFVGRANANNGITACVDLIEEIQPYKAGSMTISLGGEYLGSCFVQPKDFYTSQNVIVLIPKNDMSFNVKQFIATMIFKESRTHYKAFINELNKHIKTDFSFYLPVDSNDNPDWEYMENFMKNIKGTIDNKLLSFNSL